MNDLEHDRASRAMCIRERCVGACVLFSAFTLMGCASTHNLKSDGFNPFGGGFTDKEMHPGLFEMTATSNRAMWPSFGAARATWKNRADQLCGVDAYEEIATSQDAGARGETPVYDARTRQSAAVGQFNATMRGYVLCRSSGLSTEQAIRFLEERRQDAVKESVEWHERQLEALGGADCGQGSPQVSPETNMRRGKTLIALGRYTVAMQCLLRAQEEAREGFVYRESCASIATMYEFGWGVGRDVDVARSWLKKSGL